MSITILSLLFGCGSARLERIHEARVPERLDALAAAGRAPGFALATVDTGGAVHTWAKGRADLTRGTPATVETTWLWFSATKIVTATAVLQLVERGLVDLDQPVVRYVPGFASVRNPHGRAVTVRHLLSHTSGLPNPMPVAWIHEAHLPGPSLDELTERLLRENDRLDFAPGARFAYSNLGYLVLGQLIERVSGERYEAYVQHHILDVLGMHSTGFVLPGGAATGYSRKWSAMGIAGRFLLDGRYFGETRDGFTALKAFVVDGAPYGGLVGTLPDMARFLGAHLGGGAYQGARILREESVALMQQPALDAKGKPLPMGLGWHLGTVDGERYAAHIGGGGGFRSEIRLYPALGYAVAVAGNETSFDTDAPVRLVVESER